MKKAIDIMMKIAGLITTSRATPLVADRVFASVEPGAMNWSDNADHHA